MSSFLQPDINKFPTAHNHGHGFRKFKTLQGCPNLAHHKLSRSTKDIPSPRTTQSDSESRLQDISTIVKQDQQSRPNVPTNPDRSCTYLVLRAHRIVQDSGRPTQSCPWWSPAADRLDQHSEEHWPGGVKIKMTLGLRKPEGKRLRWQMVNPRLGLAGGVLFKANCQGGPIPPTA